VEILAGVQEGDALVLDPPVSFADGVRVKAGGKP
jgi:hypothetical protein